MDPADPNSCVLYLGTRDGLRVTQLLDGSVDFHTSGLEGNVVRDIAIHPDDPADAFVGCGLRGWGLHHTTDGGHTFESVGFEDVWVWGVTRHPIDPEVVFVGTEPPMVWISRDNGETFESCGGIETLESRPHWTFFHEPFEQGHVHGIAIHPDRPASLFAGVEHGALIYSRDGGDTWHETLVGHDLHRVAIHPDDPDHVLAATGSGLYRSRDAGSSWDAIEPLRGTYLHTIQFDPTATDRLFVYADQEGDPIFVSEDGGETWRSAGHDLPAAMPADNLRRHPTNPDTLVYAGDVRERQSQLFVSEDLGETWGSVGAPLPKVWRVEVAPVAETDPV